MWPARVDSHVQCGRALKRLSQADTVMGGDEAKGDEAKRVTGNRKSILAAAAIVGGMVVLAAGCMQTQEIDQTLPPYASISDEARDPASAPKPPPSDDFGGTWSAIGQAIVFPLRIIGEGFGMNL